MKRLILLMFGSMSMFQVQAQETTNSSNENPFSFDASYVGDVVRNFAGGIKKGGTSLGMANLKLGFETEKAGWWQGGEFFLNAANTHGGEPSANFIGDYQIASNLEAGDLTYLQEFWFKQQLGKVALVVGLQDLAVEFLSSENAGLYLNSSFGVHSTISNNSPVPIFPLTALGVQFHYHFTEKFTFKTALFDGVPDDFSKNRYNIKWKICKKDGFLSFSELSLDNSASSSSGIYKIGVYYHNKYACSSQDESGTEFTENCTENYGCYVSVDQSLFKDESGRELTLFTQGSISPKHLNANWYYLGGGINCKGWVANRTDDVLGFACAHSGINNEIGSETTFELTYKTQLGEHFFVQPDFQYIINPAGTDEKLKNSAVGFVRIGLNF